MKLKRSQSPLAKKARRGFRGYPAATIAFYGPDASRATKVAVGVVRSEGGDPDTLERWFAEEGDIRDDLAVLQEVLELLQREGILTVVMPEQIIGCPHEEALIIPREKFVLRVLFGPTVTAGRGSCFSKVHDLLHRLIVAPNIQTTVCILRRRTVVCRYEL